MAGKKCVDTGGSSKKTGKPKTKPAGKGYGVRKTGRKG